MAQPIHPVLQAVVAEREGQSRVVQIDKSFHDAAYRRGEFSLTVNGPASNAFIDPRSAAAGSEMGWQSPWSLDGELGKLAGFGQGADVALTRLMSAVAQGAADFVRDARDLPQTWRWSCIPEPQNVRHIHFGVNEMPDGGYRLDVSACLETQRADMEVQLAFAMRVNATAGRVTGLIVSPEVRQLPAIAAASGNVATKAVTTAGITPAKAPVDDKTLVAAAGA